MEENEEEYRIYRKIEPNRKIRVFKNTYNDVNYYKVQVTQKNYDGTEYKAYIGLQFKKGVELDNETDIVIKKAYENIRENPKDKYNPIVYLVVTQFETIEREEQKKAEALEKFNENLMENEMEEAVNAELPF